MPGERKTGMVMAARLDSAAVLDDGVHRKRTKTANAVEAPKKKQRRTRKLPARGCAAAADVALPVGQPVAIVPVRRHRVGLQGIHQVHHVLTTRA